MFCFHERGKLTVFQKSAPVFAGAFFYVNSRKAGYNKPVAGFRPLGEGCAGLKKTAFFGIVKRN
jgi:hypothetical protein